MKFIKKYIRSNFTNFTFFYSILKHRIFIVIFLSICTGVLDSIGLTMFLPLLQLADGGSNVNLGNLSFITDFLSFFGIKLTIVKALLFLVLVFIIKGIVVYKSNIYKVKAQQILTKKIRMIMVNKFPTYQFDKFVKTDVGKIQNIFLGEIIRLSNTFTNYLNMIQGAIMVLVYVLFSFVVNWQFALLVCLGGLLSNLVFNKINKLTKEKSKKISTVNNTFANVLIQYINNFKYIKATGKILSYREKVEKGIDDVQYETLMLNELTSKVLSFREPMLICIIATVVLLQVIFFSTNFSAIMVSLLFFYRALTSIVAVQNSYNSTIANQGAIDNILSFISELDAYTEKVGNRNYIGFSREIKLNQLSFKYDDTSVLESINFTINKNQSIALVGESGSGKTTLVNILIKLLNANSGEILIDGVNLNEYNQFTYQDKIGYITQEPTIFNDTIYNNVTFWAEKSPENINKFNQALRQASIFDFVDSLEQQSESQLGNNGINLSGGQRQRISIARELFKEVEILILDEATSALDSETEKEIQKSIDYLKGQLTIISIAHRLATIKDADVIYLLDKGKIIGSGSFTELCNLSPRFKKMVELQEI